MRAQAERIRMAPAIKYMSTKDALAASLAFYGPAIVVGENYPADRRERLADAMSDAWNSAVYGYWCGGWGEKEGSFADAVKACIDYHINEGWDGDFDSIY